MRDKNVYFKIKKKTAISFYITSSK